MLSAILGFAALALGFAWDAFLSLEDENKATVVQGALATAKALFQATAEVNVLLLSLLVTLSVVGLLFLFRPARKAVAGNHGDGVNEPREMVEIEIELLRTIAKLGGSEWCTSLALSKRFNIAHELCNLHLENLLTDGFIKAYNYPPEGSRFHSFWAFSLTQPGRHECVKRGLFEDTH